MPSFEAFSEALSYVKTGKARPEFESLCNE
jgi:hypothetical protein